MYSVKPNPCPFCRCMSITTRVRANTGKKFGSAYCASCGAYGPLVMINESDSALWREEAFKAWNDTEYTQWKKQNGEEVDE